MHLRRKLVAATALMLVCAILLVSASFAWLSISSAPEISGVDTNIGSNGSLEIALLSGLTYPDPDRIRTGIGDSLEVEDRGIANETWGNVIELSEGYGLDEVSLRPARLNVMPDGNGNHVVGSNLLVYPRYGEDGRSSDFYQNSVSATYVTDKFAYFLQDQDYGVRAIGSVSKLSVQQTALGNARSRVKSYTQSALRTATSAWAANGEAYLDLYIRHYYLGSDEYQAKDIGTIRSMAAQMRTAINYIDLALRQGVVGFAASVIGDEDAFRTVRAGLENQLVPLHDTLTRYSEYFEIPGGFSSWASVIQGDLEALNRVVKDCDLWLSEGGEEPAWGDIEWMLRDLMNADKVYWNGDLLPEMSVIAPDNVLTLTPDAGPMSHIAEFAGDYSAFFSYIDEATVEVKTLTSVDVPHLAQVSGTLELLSAASGSDELESVPLEDIYGFSVDLAFRCNRLANLLLQTAPAARVEGDDLNQENQGSGSYMEFYSDQLSGEQVSKMMGAIRVGFLDDRNHLVALAKCGTEFDVSGDSAKAYLYLHEFTVKADGSISVGDPRELDSAIKTLDDGVPAVLTVVVWLDGDYVDNSMAAISGSTMSGKLNLQFAADRELNPAIGGASTPPGSDTPDEPTPDTPDEPAPSVPTEQAEFYLEHNGNNRYSFYTLNPDGSREYELTFKGSMDTDTHTVTVNSVTSYPANGVAIPALATYTESNEEYAVSVYHWGPFANLGTEEAAVFFIPIDGEKVSVTATGLSLLFDTDPGTEFALLDLSGLDTSATTDMSDMFDDCSNLTQLNLSGLDTTNVTDMSHMFFNCYALTELDVSSFDTSNVTKMLNMFCNCEDLIKLDLSNFDTSNVTEMFRMFSGCRSLTDLDVSSFNTANVRGMSAMFSGCHSLTELDVSSFNTDSLIAIASMFEYCSSLKELNLSGFNTAKVEQMFQLFDSCSSLTKLDISNFDTSNVYNMDLMFYGCSSLTELDLSSFDTTILEEAESCLSGCRSLKTIVAPKAVGTVNIYLPGSYVCEADGNTYTVIDQTVPAQAVLVKK